jgi:FkbM family methyltransferase
MTNAHEVQRFFSDYGDTTVRLNYDLNENSIVFDLGFYMGDFTEKIINKYDCFVYGYEPIQKYYDLSLHKFRNNPKIKIFNYGLGNCTETVKITDSADSSSIYQEALGNFEVVNIIDISDEISNLKIKKIDLMKINIEGSEYTLLDGMIKSGIIGIVDNLQIQFHKEHETEITRDYIQSHLKNTHNLTYNYTYVWENWKLK